MAAIVRVIMADYAVTPDFLVHLAGEYDGVATEVVPGPDGKPQAVEFTFRQNPSAAAKDFRTTLDSCFRRAA